jgi:hypothetical protein
VAGSIFTYLRSGQVGHRRDEFLLKVLFAFPQVFSMDHLALTIAVISDPDLPDRIPELRNENVYGIYAEIVRKSNSPQGLQRPNFRNPSDETVATLRSTLKQARFVDEPREN